MKFNNSNSSKSTSETSDTSESKGVINNGKSRGKNSHSKCKNTLSSLNKIKSKILNKTVSVDRTSPQSSCNKGTRKSSTTELLSKSKLKHSASVSDLSAKNSPKSKHRVTRKQSFDDRAYRFLQNTSSSCLNESSLPRSKQNARRKQSIDERSTFSSKSRLTNATPFTTSPRQRRLSLPNVTLDKSKTKNKLTAKDSPRLNRECNKYNDNKDESIFEVHYVEYETIQREDSFKRTQDEGNYNIKEEMNAEEDFQVTARTSSKSRKMSDDLSKKTFVVEDKQTTKSNEPELIEEPETGFDSLEDEDEEEEEESSENEHLHFETEAGDEDDSLQSPLEQHFEYLADDPEVEEKPNQTYHVNESPNVETKEKKNQGFLSRCRSSISAKFLSRSQKSQPGKNSQTSEEQRKRLDSLKRIIDQNQNYGPATSRQLNTKEAKRIKKLTAKSEPNLSLGIPPTGKSSNRKSSGMRRGSGVTAESQMDLRSIKEVHKSENEISSKDRVRHLKGSSTGSMSPNDHIKSTSDIISMFNQRSSTPKPKQFSHPSSPVKTISAIKSSSRSSPGVSPVASPTRVTSGGSSYHKDERVLRSSDNKTTSKHEDSEAKSKIGSNAVQLTEHAAKRRPRRSVERPGVKHRPKSLVIPPSTSFEDLLGAHVQQVHSDTELDDEGRDEKEASKVKLKLEAKTQRKSLPSSSKNNLETLRESNSSLVMCDIQIDDTLKNSSRKSWVDSTVGSSEEIVLTKTLVNSDHERTFAKRLSDLSEAIEDTTVAFSSTNNTQENDKRNTGNEDEYSKPTVDVKYWNGSSTPPERDVPIKLDNSTGNVEAKQVDRTENVSKIEDEVTLSQCHSVVEDFVKSFKEMSSLQDQVLKQKDSDRKKQLLQIFSTTYCTISDNINEQKVKIEKNCTMKNGVTFDEDVNKLLATISNSDLNHDGEKEKTDQVINILEHYSNAIIKLVEKKLDKDVLEER